MLFDPAFNQIIKRPKPTVTLIDLMDDVTDLTTYTFANRQFQLPRAGSLLGETSLVAPYVPSRGKGIVVACIHSEDAAIDWSVSTISIGGVNGTIFVDRIGATNAISTAVAYWDTQSLGSIANTDVVVTFSEAVTSCAVGLLLVEGIGYPVLIGADSATSTSTIGLASTPTGSELMLQAVQIVPASCVTGGGTEFPEWDNGWNGASRQSQFPEFTQLYHGSNAEMDFACAYSVVSTNAGANPSASFAVTVRWSGTGAGDAVSVVAV